MQEGLQKTAPHAAPGEPVTGRLQDRCPEPRLCTANVHCSQPTSRLSAIVSVSYKHWSWPCSVT